MHAADILMPVPLRASVIDRLEQDFSLHRLWEQTDPDAYLADVAPRIRGLAVGGHFQVDAPFLDTFQMLKSLLASASVTTTWMPGTWAAGASS